VTINTNSSFILPDNPFLAVNTDDPGCSPTVRINGLSGTPVASFYILLYQ
jgi:hypothetical protein